MNLKKKLLATRESWLKTTVKEIDLPNRTVTLEFEDGATRTFPVRSDVDLKPRKAGEKAAFRVTEMVAITVEKP